MHSQCLTAVSQEKFFYFVDASVTGSVTSALCCLLGSIDNSETLKTIVHAPLQCNSISALSAKPTEMQFISGYSQRYHDYLASSQYNKGDNVIVRIRWYEVCSM